MKSARLMSAASNTLTVFLGLGLMGTAIWMAMSSPSSACLLAYQGPVLVIGAVVFLAALAGLLGSVCGNGCLACLQTTVTGGAMGALLAFIIFVLIATGPGGRPSLVSRGFPVFLPSHFSPWMRTRATGAAWAPLGRCLYAHRTCGDMREYVGEGLKGRQLSPLEAGCCLPPEGCALNSTNLPSPEYLSFAVDLPDAPKGAVGAAVPATLPTGNCSGFGFAPSQLCYNCAYCQGGLLSQLRNDLRAEAFVCLGVFVGASLMLMVSCGAYWGARLGRKERKERKERVEKRAVNLTRQETIVVSDALHGPRLSSVPTFKRTLTIANDGALVSGNPQFSRTLTRVEQALNNDVKSFTRSVTFVAAGETSGGQQAPPYSRVETFQVAEPSRPRANASSRGSEVPPHSPERLSRGNDRRSRRREEDDYEYDEERARRSDARSDMYDDDDDDDLYD